MKYNLNHAWSKSGEKTKMLMISMQRVSNDIKRLSRSSSISYIVFWGSLITGVRSVLTFQQKYTKQK